MMKNIKKTTRVFSLLAIAATLLGSCIREEPLNAECDIIGVTLPDDELNRSPIIGNNRITLIVKNNVDITSLAPQFELTPGASIEPASGTRRDFTRPQTYTVTSQDGEWKKNYTVEVQRNTEISLSYSFEKVKVIRTSQGGSYDEFYDVTVNAQTQQTDTMFWASGNSGFAMTNGTADPDSYPTFRTEDGFKGKCVEMVTRSTGPWGAMVKKPLAAGNLFIGKFNVSIAVAHPLEATQFGTPFYSVPSSISGHYRYTPGETYEKMNESGKLEPQPEMTDECNLYAVFFEITDGMEWLDGTNVLAEDNPNIVAVAQFSPEQRKETQGWESFNLPFVFRPGKTVDKNKLAAGHYSITVVMSSSIEGDYFSGAVGSRLLVDEIEITCH